MEWEEQESFDDIEFWIVGEKSYDKKFNDDVWTFMADVFIDKKNDCSEIEFDVFTLPRHIVEDSDWKTLRDGIEDLKHVVEEMERIDEVTKKLKLKIFSDEFIGFKTRFKVRSTNKEDIESKIKKLRDSFEI